MSQRTQLTLGLLLTAACLASAASVWKLAQRDAVPARADSDAALNARLDRLITTIESAQKTSDWVNLQLRLVLEQPDGPPAEGFAVDFPEILVAPRGTLKMISGPTGVVDLGLVRAGRHSFTVTSPWNTVCGVGFDVRPGSPSQTEVVICPAAAPPAGNVTIDFDWPEDLRLANFGLVVTVDSQSQKMHGWEWHDMEAVRHSIFLAGDGTVMKYFEGGTSWGYEEGNNPGLHPVLNHNAQLDAVTLPLFCRGSVQICNARSIAIKLPDREFSKSRANDETPAPDDRWMQFRHLDADCQIAPQELALKPTGPNRFEIVLSGKTLAELRAVLKGDESASRRSRDE